MFPPAFAPRMGYLCKYMKRAGWEPVVITEKIPDDTFSFLSGNAEVHAIQYYTQKGKISKKLEWIIVFLADLLFHYKDRKMNKIARKIATQSRFSGVLCCTYRTFPLPAARKIAHHFNLPFVADIRDIVEQYAGHEFLSHSLPQIPIISSAITWLLRQHLLFYRNRELRKADWITTVSPWHVEQLKQYNPNVQLIYNGFDPELFYPEQIKTPQFRIVYTGRMISLATRDPNLLFEAIAQLDKKQIIHPETFRVQWYTDKASQLMLEPLINKYNINNYIDFFGYVPASQIPQILNKSSILLQLANKSDEIGPKGFMTTKFFESLAVEKPMLCVRSDEGCLETAIIETNAGVSARNVDEVYHFIQQKYSEWEEKGYTTSTIKKDVLNKYSRQTQALEFMHIFEKLNQEKK